MTLVINDTTPQDQYTATASQTQFSITFEFFENSDIKVYNGDTVLSYNASPSSASQYSVTGAGTNSTKRITLGSPGATAGDVITILRDIPVARTSDFPTSGPFNVGTLNTELDTITAMVAERENEIARAIRAPENDPSSIDLVLPSKANRLGKILAFDSTTGDPVAGDEIGNYRGNWAASTAYAARDMVKDTSTNNVFRCNTGHTSSGAQPLTGNTDAAKWDLIVDAAAAATSATAAATSATASATSATASATSATASADSATASAASQTAAATSATASATSATASAGSATSAASTLATFQGQYHGAASSDPSSGLDAGDLYFNTSSNVMRVYNGSTWQDAAVDASSFLTAADNLNSLSNKGTSRTNLGVAIGSDVQAFDADILKADTTDELTAGFTAAIHDAGVKNSGTFTPDPADGNFQQATNDGAHAIGVPTSNCTMVILYKNGGSCAAITTSAFTVVEGSFSTTVGHEHMAFITRINDGSNTFSLLTIKALQ